MIAKKISPVNSCDCFRINWQCWKLMGHVQAANNNDKPKNQQKPSISFIWSLTIYLTADIMFPMHLMLGIFFVKSTQSVLFENVAIAVTSFGTSIKFLMFLLKINKIKGMQHTIEKLDERVLHNAEVLYFTERIQRKLNKLKAMYVIVYSSVAITASLVFVCSNERRLFYPGWLPFDWRHSLLSYVAAIGFQLFGIFFQILQNFTNDSFSPKALCILSGHIKLLYKRVARIGYDERLSLEEHEKELNRCVADQMRLYELYDTIQNIISWPILLQLLISVANACVAMVVLVFFATDIYSRVYYVCYFIGMTLQLFPACYYGSDFVLLFENLHYAVFSCNWTHQTKRFKRHMMIFTERSLRRTMAMAGGIFPIHLDTFFVTCKGAYSLFAVVLTMK